MWIENTVYLEDLEQNITDRAIEWGKLAGKNFLISGATGLIGSAIIDTLMYYEAKNKSGMHICAIVRDAEAAAMRFHDCMKSCPGTLSFAVTADISLPIDIPDKIDYIIHCAGQTASKMFTEKPVETIRTAFEGTANLLDLAVKKKCGGFVYLSSMEIYGTAARGKALGEKDAGLLDPLCLRNDYPMGKRMCETLCLAYASEYRVKSRIVRLAQTFGAGADMERDKRVLSYFVKCIMGGQDIFLKTDGRSERSCLYTADAVAAILTVLTKGEDGIAYNAANDSSYSSIAETAETAAAKTARGKIKTHIPLNVSEEDRRDYPPEYYWKLDCSALKKLGWDRDRSVEEILGRTLRAAQE